MTSSIRKRFPPSWVGAGRGGNKARRGAQLPVPTRVVIDQRREDAAPFAELSVHDGGGAVVVSLHGELDFLSASSLQAYLSGIPCHGRARLAVDLTGLDFIDCACLRVLVACCEEIRGRGGGIALTRPHGAVLRILAVTGLLSWFEVHDSVEGAVTGSRGQRSAALLATPSGCRPRGGPAISAEGSRMLSEVSVSQGSAVAADHGSDRGGGAVPALGWLS
jgi:anti-sigma B factor antagonist